MHQAADWSVTSLQYTATSTHCVSIRYADLVVLSSQLIDRATSPSEEDDLKAKQQSLEESWQELSLIKAVPKPQLKMRREDLEEPLLSPATAVQGQEPQPALLAHRTPCFCLQCCDGDSSSGRSVYWAVPTLDKFMARRGCVWSFSMPRF